MKPQSEQLTMNHDVVRLINYTDLTPEDSQRVLAMRNHPEIKKWMYHPQDISESEHRTFIETLKNTTNKVYFLVKREKTVIGTVNLTQIDDAEHSAELGLYANPFVLLPGRGQILLQAVARYAFNERGLEYLMLDVYSDNQRAIRSYEKQGFKKMSLKTVNGIKVLSMKKTHPKPESV